MDSIKNIIQGRSSSKEKKSKQQQDLSDQKKQNFTMVYYYIPEDHDDPNEPNAFGINKNIEDVKYLDIEKNFPLNGKYYFRFKYMFQEEIVWFDLKSQNHKIPLFNNRIFVKATRVSWDQDLSIIIAIKIKNLQRRSFK